jgi:hypothetical protein
MPVSCHPQLRDKAWRSLTAKSPAFHSDEWTIVYCKFFDSRQAKHSLHLRLLTLNGYPADRGSLPLVFLQLGYQSNAMLAKSRPPALSVMKYKLVQNPLELPNMPMQICDRSK